MKIMSLINRDVFIEAIKYSTINSNEVEDVILTHEVFKAMSTNNLTFKDLENIADYIKKYKCTMIELKEVVSNP